MHLDYLGRRLEEIAFDLTSTPSRARYQLGEIVKRVTEINNFFAELGYLASRSSASPWNQFYTRIESAKIAIDANDIASSRRYVNEAQKSLTKLSAKLKSVIG